MAVANTALRRAARRLVSQALQGDRLPPLLSVTAHSRLPVSTECLLARRLKSCAWLAFPGAPRPPLEAAGLAVRTLGHARLRDLRPHDPAQDPPVPLLPPLRVLSFDIEAVSETRGFPDAALPADVVCTIGLVEEVLFGEQARTELVLALGDTVTDATTIQTCASEAELLLAFAQYLRTSDADVIVGYNIDTFDWAYIAGRLQYLHTVGALTTRQLGLAQAYSRAGATPSPPTEQKLQSAAYGDNVLVTPRMPGRLNLDLWLERKRANRPELPNLKLNTLAKFYLGDAKHDLSPQELFRCVLEGTAADRGRVATYCAQDCRLVLDLVRHLQVVPSVLQMAAVTRVCPQDLLCRGQSVKVYTQLVAACLEAGDLLVVDGYDGEPPPETGRYEGASVLQPTPHFHLDPVLVLDFMSLYPSIMQTYNLSPETRVLGEPPPGALAAPGLVTYFVGASGGYRGLIPRVLDMLMTARREAKGELKRATTDTERALLDARQLSYKISANSVYGFCGSRFGALRCVPVAEATTAWARATLQATIDLVGQRWPAAEVVYGDTDSVFVRLPGLAPAEAHAQGAEMAAAITGALAETLAPNRSYLVLEFEKRLQPLCLLRKKRYMALAFETLEDPGHVYAKGIELVRRDAVPLLKEAQTAVLAQLLTTNVSFFTLVGTVRAAVDKLLAIPPGGPFGPLIQSKALRAKYVAPEGLAHVQLAARLNARQPGSAPRVGDRVEFLVLASQLPRVVDRVECAVYAEAHKLPPAWDHYHELVERALLALIEVPLQTHAPALLAELRNDLRLTKTKAQRLVQQHAVTRQGNGWIRGHRALGGRVQLTLDTVLRRPAV